MESLKERLRKEGRNLGNGILQVDSILTHQLDPALMVQIGKDFARLFDDVPIDRILTAEVSGIAPALMVALELGVPVVYARKKRPITMTGPVHAESTRSHTKGNIVELIVSSDFLRAGEKVLIIDDFLATGETLKALARLVLGAGAILAGAGCVIEKQFEKGREAMKLAGFHVPIHTLAIITSMAGGKIEMA